MALDFAKVETEVAETEGVEASTVLLLNRIAAEIRAGAGDQARMDALADRLDASAAALAAAAAEVPGEGGEEPTDPTPSPSA